MYAREYAQCAHINSVSFSPLAVITITQGVTSPPITTPPIPMSETLFSSQMVAINSLQRLLEGRLTAFYIVDTLLTGAACSQLQMKDSW